MANEQLVVQLEARIRDFERQMIRANRTATANFTAIERRGEKMTAKLKGLGANAFAGFSKGALGAAAAALSVTAAIQGIKGAFDKFGAIADQSAAAGISPEFFQGIAYQSSLAGVEIDALAGALAGFAKNAGLAAEGKGKMVSTLKALDPILLRNIQNATTQEERFKLVADALRDASSAAQAAAIASAAFGDQGPKVVAAFRGGADEIDRMAAKAKEMGLIVDNDLIARADELGDNFDSLVQVIDIQMKSALLELGPVLISLTGYAAGFAKEIRNAVELLKDPGEWIPFLAGTTGTDSRIAGVLQGLRTELNAAKMDSALGINNGAGGMRETFMGAGSSRSNDIGGGVLGKDLEALFGIKLAAREATAEVAALFDTVGSGSGSFASLLEEFGGTPEKGGGPAAKIAEIGEAATIAVPPVQELTDQFALLEDIGRTAIDGIVSALEDGQIEATEFGDILKNIGTQLLNSGLNSLLGGLMGGFGGGSGLGSGAVGRGVYGGSGGFFPGFANGTRFAPGGMALVGERGPELVNLPRGSQVLPAAQTARAMSMPDMARATGGGGVSISMPITIDATGADAAGLARVEQRLAQLKGELPGLTVKAVRDAKKRGVKL
jgi:hypothetical protein